MSVDRGAARRHLTRIMLRNVKQHGRVLKRMEGIKSVINLRFDFKRDVTYMKQGVIPNTIVS